MLEETELHGENPESFAAAGETHGYQTKISWSPGSQEGCFDVMFIDRGRIVFSSEMEQFEARYAEVVVNPERLAAARALGPMSERPGFGRSVLLFGGVDRQRLAELGEVRTPSIADVFVAVIGGRAEAREGVAA